MTMPALLLGLMAASVACAFYALPGLVSLTKDALGACQTLLDVCVEFAVATKLFFFWAASLIAATGLLYASMRAAFNVVAARRALFAMPIKRSGSVALIIDNSLRTAFTSGLLNPTIYISTGLMKSLDRDELRAVFFHELEHRKNFDPLRFLAFGFIRDAFFYLPAIRQLAARARLEKEHDADDAAALRPGGPLSLASAMVKVAREGRLYAALAENNEQVTGRIRRLIEGPAAPLRLSARAVVVSFVVPAALVLSLSVPIFAGPVAHECTMKKCEKHAQAIEGCKEHCEAKQDHHH